MTFDPQRDLEINRIIKAPRQAIWAAWTQADQFAQWWVPHPEICRVVTLDVRPGGGMVTQISAGAGEPFGPHMDACFLDVKEEHRIVFTNALIQGWRPAEQPFITAVISLEDHTEGTAYRAHVMHKNSEDKNTHETLGFYDGWGTVTAQLAKLVEG